MTFARALRALLVVALVGALSFIASCSYFSLRPIAPSERVRLYSTWKAGELVTRAVREHGAPFEAPPPEADTTLMLEEGVAEAPMLALPGAFELGVVPGMDGVAVTVDGKTAYVSVDDLLRAHAYDHTTLFGEAGLGVGLDRAVVLASAAKDLGMTAAEVAARASYRRVRFERRPFPGPEPKPEPRITDATLTESSVREAVRAAARYLTQNIDGRGRFRYLVDAATNKTIPGYSWPRHAGATFFLAQDAALEHDPAVTYAALRAAGIMRDERLVPCGEHRCIAEDDDAEIGSSALALIALSEIVRGGIDATYKPTIEQLAGFLRSQQRADGEFMHLYDRAAKRPLDVQLLYFSGEATLALSRAHRITGDPRDLDGATRGLGRLVGTGWHFFGDRYYFSEEHWTCQAMEDLWERAPNHEALAFCKRWHEYQRRLQYGPGEHAMDAEGAFGVGNFLSPRTTPASSRGEAAGATLLAVLREERTTGRADPERALLERELSRAVAFVMRHQLRPGPSHLFADPRAVLGAMPGSDVDWQIRIDYLQHAGSMMVRWLELQSSVQDARNSVHPTR